MLGTLEPYGSHTHGVKTEIKPKTFTLYLLSSSLMNLYFVAQIRLGSLLFFWNLSQTKCSYLCMLDNAG